MREGGDGLLRDKIRPSRVPPLAPDAAERVVALTLGPPPGETTHWTAAAMARAGGVSIGSVQRIWRAHGLQPHRLRQLKLLRDPAFAAMPLGDPTAKQTVALPWRAARQCGLPRRSARPCRRALGR